MRQAYVISYDIADPKRWRKIYRLLLGVGDPVQWSVFRSDMTDSEKFILLEKLIPILNQAEDRVMFIDLGPARGMDSGNERIETWGKPLREMPERGPVII